MPSNENYVRDYKQEGKTAKKRGETGVGSSSSDAKRHRARRAYIKKHGALSSDIHIDHKNPIKSGGSNALSNLTTKVARDNTSHGGEIGDKAGKANGARKGHKSRKAK
jgi:hypothetical protein